MVGYRCPDCSGNLFMVVYPQGREQRIETQEKGVYLARAYTCGKCNCFYTPRPGRLLAEGDVYEMAFGGDRRAYEDYRELLGRNGGRISNCGFNEYEADYNRRGQQRKPDDGAQQTHALSAEEAVAALENLCRQLEGLPDGLFERLKGQIEESFYPDSAVRKHEESIRSQTVKRKKDRLKKKDTPKEIAVSGGGKKSWRDINHGGLEKRTRDSSDKNTAASGVAGTGEGREDGKPDGGSGVAGVSPQAQGSASRKYGKSGADSAPAAGTGENGAALAGGGRNSAAASDAVRNSASLTGGGGNSATSADTGGNSIAAAGAAGNRKDGADTGGDSRTAPSPAQQYQARLAVLDRLSKRQRAELKKQVEQDKTLDDAQRQELLRPIQEADVRERVSEAEKKVDACENRPYAFVRRVYEEIDRADIPQERKRPFLERLRDLLFRRGREEVGRIMESLPEHMDRTAYRKLEQRLAAYPDVDMSPYEQTLRERREGAEKEEIAGMVKRARKQNREDYVNLMQRLEQQNFAEENVGPYLDQIRARIRELDQKELDELSDVVSMDYDSAMEAYEKVSQGMYLPELKENALGIIRKRLQKLKTDECELLVRKLKDDLAGKIAENPRHHFYPARKVLMKEASKEETAVIDTALQIYGTGRGPFEYPILVVDTSHGHSGKEGMILTPEHLFYSTKLSAYDIPVGVIDSVKASTGLLNRRVTVEEKNGAKHRIPYAVGTNEMTGWARALEQFIRYLQQKPASRKVNYLAKETHETICCYRCGYVYHGSDVCPRCGYKKNH